MILQLNPDIRLEQNWTMGRRFDKPAAGRAAAEPTTRARLPARGGMLADPLIGEPLEKTTA